MGYDLGAATGKIEIGYDGKGVDQAKSALGTLAGAGSSVASALSSAFTSAATAAGVLAVAIAGVAIKGGIARQLKIEDAQAKLKGLGHDAQSVETIMNSALESVKGTSYGLDEAASVAATAVAAGIEPGQELEKYLRLTADAATIAGTSMGEMGSIINKTTTAGKVYADNLNQLADRGIPIYQWLQEEMGVTADELREMVSRGEVDSETFRKVIEKNIGGAALASGDTTRGAFKNMLAALSRTGVALTKGIFPYFKDFFGLIMEGLDSLNTAIGPTFEILGKVAGEGLLKVGELIKSVLSSVDLSGLRDSFSKIGPLIAPIAGLLLGLLGPMLAQIPILGAMFAGLTGPIGLAVGAVIGLLAAFPQLREGAMNVINEIVGGIKAFVSAFSAADGDITSSGFPGFMERVAAVAAAMFSSFTGGLEAFASAFAAADGDITSSGFAGFMEMLGYAASQIMPTLRAAFDGVKEAVDGFIEGFGGIDVLVETLGGLLPLIAGPLGLVRTALMDVFGSGGGDIDFAGFGQAAGEGLRPLADAAVLVAEALVGALGQAIPIVLDLVQQLAPVVVNLVSSFAPLIAQLVGDLAPVIANLAATLFPVLIEVISVVATVISELAAVVGPLAVTLLGQLVPVIGELAQILLPMLAELFATIVPVVGQLLAAIVPLVAQLVGAFLPIIMTLVSAVLPLLAQGLELVVAVIQAVVIPAITFLVNVITTVLVPVFQALLPIVTTVFGGMAELIAAAMKIIQGIISVVSGLIANDWGMVWNGIKLIFSGMWDAIKAIVTTAINIVKTIISGALGLIKSLWASAWDAIKSKASSSWESIKSGITTAINAIKSVISRIIGQIKSDMTNAWNAVKSATDRVWNGIKTAVSNAISSVAETIRGLKGKVLSAFSGAGSWLVSAGKDIIRGLITGIKNMASGAVDAAKSVVSGAVDGAKRLLGISSPSKVFAEIGSQTVEGLVVGLDHASDDAAKAAARVAQNVADNGSATLGLAYEMDALTQLASRLGMDGAFRALAPTPRATAQVVQHNAYNYPVAERDSVATNRALQLASEVIL